MMSDRHGEMGFMEAMVCTVAVCIVLNAFIAFSAADSLPEDSALNGFDAESALLDCSDGIVIDDEYLNRFMISGNLSGISVSVGIPYFAEELAVKTVGDLEGLLCRNSFVLMVEYDNGRHVPAIMEVSAYA